MDTNSENAFRQLNSFLRGTMSPPIKKFSALIVFSFGLLSGCTTTERPRNAPPSEPTILVQGFGEVQASPDVAEIALGVESRAAAAQEAIAEANRKMASIIASATAGTNQVHGLNLSIQAPEPLEEEARKKAMADARRRAAELAKHAGLELGEIIEIQNVQASRPYLRAQTARSESLQNALPIEGG